MSEVFETQAAYSPENQQLVKNALFTTHDVNTGTPLPALDAQGAPLVLRSDSNGFLPPFKVEPDVTQVEIRNGSFSTVLTTIKGAAKRVMDDYASGPPIALDPYDPGVFVVLDPTEFTEDPADPGTFLVGSVT